MPRVLLGTVSNIEVLMLIQFLSASSKCWFCQHGYTNRCQKSLALGTAQINGCQAEYVRVPEAEGTLRHAPEGMEDELLVMMSDIFPTGYYGAMRAVSALQQNKQPLESAAVVCLGCGIVGLCAIMTAVTKGVGTVFCIDSVEDRLEQAKLMGGMPLRLGVDDIRAAVMKATDGRGADAVVESVGNEPALRSAFDLLRPCGVLSSLGFHQSAMPFTALEGYQKNIRSVTSFISPALRFSACSLDVFQRVLIFLIYSFNMGRAPVGAVFDEALQVFIKNKKKFEGLITHRLPMEEAAKGYVLFSTQQARKVVLRPGSQ